MQVSSRVPRRSWNKDELKLAFYLYFQLPFGRLHSKNPEIIELARLIGRTPSSVAMKLVNFASLDPSITSSGRSGLKGASNLDREVWREFHSDWESLAGECESLRLQFKETNGISVGEETPEYLETSYVGETKVTMTEQRLRQGFFRRAVLSNYRERCCMSGVSETRLLVASHIVPWGTDKANRLNPKNGLCLSAIHDKAFDKGLISLSDDLRVILSDALLSRTDEFIVNVFHPLRNHPIDAPSRFDPDRQFLQHHRSQIFLG